MSDEPANPRFFLSYSKTKALSVASVERFVSAVNEVVEKHFGGMVIDPMVSQICRSIRGDVIESLSQCDLVIAETTNAAPNVYYEIGFAEALHKPVILFLDAERGTDDSLATNAEMRRIRSRVFGSEHPSDLGDMRYIPYTLPDGPSNEHLDNLKSTIRNAIDAALAYRLSESMIGPVRAIQNTFQNGQDMLARYARDPSKVWMINGLSLYVDGYYGRQLSTSPMRVDESVYESMLKAMPTLMRTSALAIADTTDEFEPFMLTTPDLASVAVRARIFVFDGHRPFDPVRFGEFVAQIWRHAKEYQCYMVDRDFVVEKMRVSGITSRTQCNSANIMSTGQSAVWYSSRPDGATATTTALLTIDGDRDLASAIETLFHDIARSSVDVSALARNTMLSTSGERRRAVKREWQRLREIGHWEPDWTGRGERSLRYYADYERHIRVWIPEYERLVSKFLDQSIEAMSQAARAGPIRVVEVGPGTGELTEKLLRRISRESRRVMPGMIESYTLVEDAPGMLERMRQRGLVSRHGPSGFGEAMFPPDGDDRIRVRPLNQCFLRQTGDDFAGSTPTVLLGSLVHHYIDVLDDDEPCFATFFAELVEKVPLVNQIVLAGLFSVDSGAQIAAWRDWLVRESGLDQDAIDRFLAGNPEMQRDFSLNLIRAAAEKHHFTARFSSVRAGVPFGVLRLERPRSTA